MNLNDLFLLLATGCILVVLERLAPLHPAQPTLRAGWRVDLLHMFLSGAVIRIGTTVLTVAASLLAVSLVPEPVRLAVRSQPDVFEFNHVLLLSDICFYAAHRTCHAVLLLWRFHAVHHSSETLDWLATYRVHPVDQILNSTAIALPVIIFGFSPVAVIAYAMIYRLHAPFLHSNVRVNFGPLRHVFASPQYHHWHHGDHPEAYDKNFAGQLAFLDRAFGTLHFPENSLPTRYGVGDPMPKGYVDQLLHPFRPNRRGEGPRQRSVPRLPSSIAPDPADQPAGS